MLTFFNLQPEAFGVDINDFSLRLVKLAKKGKAKSLVSWNEVPIRPGVIKEGAVLDQEALAAAIKLACQTVKGKKLDTASAIVSLPEEKSFSQVVRMPTMSKEELAGAVPFEAENYIPLPLEKVYLDFEAIAPGQVLINVMPKAIVDSYLSCFKKAGVQPMAMEVESQAMVRCLAPAAHTDLPVIFIDFSQTKTTFIIFSGNSIRFTSTIPISSGQLTAAIAKNLQIPVQRAEELKIRHGLVTQKGQSNHDIVSAMDPVLSDLASQIKKYINFYQGHLSQEYFTAEGNIEKIILFGGGANLKELPDFLYKKLRIPVEIGNPLAGIVSSPLAIPPAKALSFATALGLGLRGILQNYD